MAAGCATTQPHPLAESRFFQIDGSRYLPLSAIATLHEMRLEWDTKTQKVDLGRDTLHLRLRVGSTIVVANGQTEILDRPVLLHHNIVVVPESFLKSLSKYFAVERKLLPLRIPYRVQTVVIDAGHGGYDTGAIGRMGLKEKHVALDIARRLKLQLEGQGLQVMMTRKEDNFISLYHRTYIANRAQGDFFISIHCNASRDREVDGFEVYHVSPSEEDAERFDSGAEASTVDAPQTFYNSSVELAKFITSAMEEHLPLPNRGVKSARFFVLKGVEMPAALVEVGYISNRSEEGLLRKKSYRQDIAEAVAAGVLSYKNEFERTGGFVN